jgi:hypothetical protein
MEAHILGAAKLRRRADRTSFVAAPARGLRDIEVMEARLLFSTVTVNTLVDGNTDDNLMSLREAVELIDHGGDDAAALSRSLSAGESALVDATEAFGTNDKIVFDNTVAGGSVSLLSPLNVAGTMTIDGGADGITLEGGGGGSDYRAFDLQSTADLTLDGLTVTHFRAAQAGAGFYVRNGSALTIRNSTVSHNSAYGPPDSDMSFASGDSATGGAVFSNQAAITIIDSTFSQNTAAGGHATATDDFATARGGTALGGAMYSIGGSLQIEGSTFSSNSTTGGNASASGFIFTDAFGGGANGGALYLGSSTTATIVNSTFAGNSVAGGVATAADFTSSGSTRGGGIYQTTGTLTMTFATVSDNVSANTRNVFIDNATATIDNSIIGQSDNSVTDLQHTGGGSVTGSNNLIRNTSETAIVNSSADPMLNALADNGGATQTMSLQVGSGAIDAAGATLRTTDQRGRARVVGSAADIGAYELAPAPSITSASTGTFSVGQAGNFTFTTATDGATPTFNATGSMPSGVILTDNGDGTATLAGTPGVGNGGQFSLNITAANGTAPDAVQAFTLTVNEAPAINVATTPKGFTGAAMNLNVTTTGYPTATISLGGDALPSGVTFTDSGDGTATIAGTPVDGSNGIYHLTVTAASGVSPDAQASVTLTITDPPPQQIAPGVSVVPTATVEAGTPLSVAVTTIGFPVPALAVTDGTLPSGVTFADLGDGTGVFSGTVAAGSAGTYNLTVTASNGVSPVAAGNLEITVTEQPSPTPSPAPTPAPTPTPTFIVEEQTLGGSSNGKRVADIALSFARPLSATPATSAFTLFARDHRQQAASARSIRLRGVTYDTATQSVSVQPVTPLRANRFFVLNADSSAIEASGGGGMLDGAANGTPGSAFQLRFGRGKRLTYIDADGDRVHLHIKGPGMMELTRNAAGEGLALRITGATSATRLRGTVTRADARGGSTTHASISGLADGMNELSPNEFTVS